MFKDTVIKLIKELGVSFLIVMVIISAVVLIKPKFIFGEEHQLTDDETTILNELFPSETIESMTIFYNSSIFNLPYLFNSFVSETVSGAAVCKWVFITDETQGNMATLVHETTHILQSQSDSFCFGSSIKALFLHTEDITNQEVSYISFYSYNITDFESELNLEQEASIIEDYYYLKYEDQHPALIYPLRCLDCSKYKRKELLPIYQEQYEKIIERYS